MAYAFKDRATAEKLRKMAGANAGTGAGALVGTDPSADNSWIVKTPGPGIDAISGDDPGKADCVPYYITQGESLSPILTNAGSSVTKRVFNLGQKIKGGIYVTAVQVGNRLIIDHALKVETEDVVLPSEAVIDCSTTGLCVSQSMQTVTVIAPDPDHPTLPGVESCISAKDLLDCLDVCGYICTYCESYSSADLCPPPPCGNCEWIWLDGAWEVLDGSTCGQDCECLTPPDFDGTSEQVETTPCEPPPPCGTCVFEWGGSVWSSYQSNCIAPCECPEVDPTWPDGTSVGEKRTENCVEQPPCGWCYWKFTGGVWIEDPANPSTCTGSCVCGPVPTNPAVEGDTLRTECVVVECCCGDAGRIATSVFGDGFAGGGASTYSQTATAPVRISNCVTELEVRWTDDQFVDPQTSITKATITVTAESAQDAADGSVTVVLDDLSPKYGNDGSWGLSGLTAGTAWALGQKCAFGNPLECNDAGCGGDLSYYSLRTDRADCLDAGDFPVSTAASSLPQPQTMKIEKRGDTFLREHPEFFTGCGCKAGVAATMNRWVPGEVTDDQIDRIVATIRSKKPRVNEAELREAIDSIFQAAP